MRQTLPTAAAEVVYQDRAVGFRVIARRERQYLDHNAGWSASSASLSSCAAMTAGPVAHQRSAAPALVGAGVETCLQSAYATLSSSSTTRRLERGGAGAWIIWLRCEVATTAD